MIQLTDDARLYLKSMLKGTLLLSVALLAGMFFVKQFGQYAGFSKADTEVKESVLTITGITGIMNEDGSSLASSDQHGDVAWLGTGQDPKQSYLGLRFRGLLPPADMIEGAYLEVVSSKDQWIAVRTKITAEKNMNPEPFSQAAQPSTRQSTSAVTTYAKSERWNAGQKERIKVTDEIKEVSLLGTQTGESTVALIIKGFGGAWGRKYIKANISSGETPRLIILYRSKIKPSVKPSFTPTRIPTRLPETTRQPEPSRSIEPTRPAEPTRSFEPTRFPTFVVPSVHPSLKPSDMVPPPGYNTEEDQ